MSKIQIRFDGPPEHVAGRFVEVEDDTGVSISIGEWVQDGDYWLLALDDPRVLHARIAELEAELRHLQSWGYPDENNPWADLVEYFGLDEETVDGAEDVARYVMERDRQAMERIKRLEAVLEAAEAQDPPASANLARALAAYHEGEK